MDDFLKFNRQALDDFVNMSRKTGARADYVQGGGGNTSVKLDDSLMAIKASGYKLSDIDVDKAYALMDYAALRDFYFRGDVSARDDWEKVGSDEAKNAVRHVDSLERLRPSVEAGFHSILDRFVNHTHSVYANLAACCAQGRDIVSRALKDAPYSYGFVEYSDPGVMLTFSIRDEMIRVERETGAKPSIIIMRNHGIIACDGDANRCLEIHDDANARIAEQFGKSAGDFPGVAVKANEEGFVTSDTPWLREELATGAYDTRFFTENSLYPDQMVFLNDRVRVYDSRCEEKPDTGCAIDSNTGEIAYSVSESEALVIEQTLAAVIYIVKAIRAAGYDVCTMGGAAKEFISGWESEKYRKQMMK